MNSMSIVLPVLTHSIFCCLISDLFAPPPVPPQPAEIWAFHRHGASRAWLLDLALALPFDIVVGAAAQSWQVLLGVRLVKMMHVFDLRDQVRLCVCRDHGRHG